MIIGELEISNPLYLPEILMLRFTFISKACIISRSTQHHNTNIARTLKLSTSIPFRTGQYNYFFSSLIFSHYFIFFEKKIAVVSLTERSSSLSIVLPDVKTIPPQGQRSLDDRYHSFFLSLEHRATLIVQARRNL